MALCGLLREPHKRHITAFIKEVVFNVWWAKIKDKQA